jgi:hypothetical protein
MVTTEKHIPAQLIGKFDNIIEAAKGLEQWEKENRGPGRPKNKGGITLGALRLMVKK